MPPTPRANRVSTQDEDGFWHHKITPSWFGKAKTCLEQARRGATGEIVWIDSDSSITGTSVHRAIEEAIEYKIKYEDQIPVSSMLYEFDCAFDQLVLQYQDRVDGEWVWEDRDEGHQIAWKNRRKPETARAFGRRCVEAWYAEIYDDLVPWATEVHVGPLRLYKDAEREIVVTCIIDYLDVLVGPVDWKTAGRKYEPWEKERWDSQSTINCWALRHRGFTNVTEVDDYPGDVDVFSFCVMVDSYPAKIQWVPIDRGDEWDRWLKQQVLSLVPLMESGATVWPKIDNHALCSAKWCEAWSDCKGRDIRTPAFAKGLDTSAAG